MTRPESTAQRVVAQRLSAARDHELSELFRVRGIAPHAAPATGWRDFFDAAEYLLEPGSIDTALTRLGRDELADLIAGGSRELLALTDADGRTLPAVAERLRGVEVAARGSATPTPADEAGAARAAERAFTTLSGIADILIHAAQTPLGRIGTGALSVTERRRLAEQGFAPTPEEADLLVRIAVSTGLLVGRDRQLGVSEAGEHWLSLATPERWSTLAVRLRDALPAGLRTADGGWIPLDAWPDAYPLDRSWPARAAEWLALAEALGLTAGAAEPAWAAPLRAGSDPDPGPLVALMPHEVDRVFLQNDLTAISPGPLAPALDARLRRMAVRESRAQASGYRFTEASIAQALSSGETADSLRAFLGDLSLTGVPQPLSYLIDRGAARHGLVRVTTDVDGRTTLVRSSDATLLRTLAVDQSLSGIGLSPAGDALATRTPRDVVFWALSEARYPVVAESSSGEAVPTGRKRVFADPERADPYGELIARLRAHQGDDSESAWLERELAGALRDRTLLAIVVNLPGGATRELVLEPIGLGGGRLRGRDAAADVERTLPLSLIASVRPA
ncbi:hypothetical protein GCM10010910_11700 [Microbacterium nanhaiense]|uniref:Helicase XPB/Ssl2 N-terminal domain-containing protein n=1 Tax=Microbacterium nanhaiense TaxID=1301026 RepID=A0ABQ2N1C4_9MICO|nr:helicase-associated domain-containing protein [Microbacterium nanhaiense]GGO62193.1 hypothetical protein GCM10010910_11700 [Microbacterium nanhaiense]